MFRFCFCFGSFGSFVVEWVERKKDYPVNVFADVGDQTVEKI